MSPAIAGRNTLKPTKMRNVAVKGSAAMAANRKKPAEEKETIGRRLARLRKERGYTQAELAELLGLAQSNVSDYERDLFRLNSEVIVQLTEIFDVSADQLLALDEKPKAATVKNRKLLKRMSQIEKLPKRDQQALLRTIDMFLRS